MPFSHLVLHDRFGHLHQTMPPTANSVKQIVLEVVPVLIHVGRVHEQLHHYTASSEIVLDSLGISPSNRSLAVQLSPGHDGVRLPLSLVDGFLYSSVRSHESTLIEITEHHQRRTLLRQFIRVADRHVERLRQPDTVAHRHARLNILAVLVTVLLNVNSVQQQNRLKEATNIG